MYELVKGAKTTLQDGCLQKQAEFSKHSQYSGGQCHPAKSFVKLNILEFCLIL